MFNDISQKKV